jgi:hypothetical protein
VSPTGRKSVEDVLLCCGCGGIGIRIFVRGFPEGKAVNIYAGSEGRDVFAVRDAEEVILAVFMQANTRTDWLRGKGRRPWASLFESSRTVHSCP